MLATETRERTGLSDFSGRWQAGDMCDGGS